jgi:hypothetical protein
VLVFFVIRTDTWFADDRGKKRVADALESKHL